MTGTRPARGYQRLVVWSKAMQLAEAVYGAVLRLPAHERYGLAAQMRGASASIPCNIAEGYGRSSRREYVRYLTIANGSLLELETQVLLAKRVGYLDDATALGLLRLTSEVGRMLARMTSVLRAKPDER